MNNMKLAALMYIGAGIFFIISGFIGGKMVYLPLAAVFIILGLRKLKQAGGQDGEE